MERGGVTNQTLPGHIFHDGQIARTFWQDASGNWFATTHGFGNNESDFLAEMNQWQGPLGFDALDDNMSAYIRSQRGIQDPQYPLLPRGNYGFTDAWMQIMPGIIKSTILVGLLAMSGEVSKAEQEALHTVRLEVHESDIIKLEDSFVSFSMNNGFAIRIGQNSPDPKQFVIYSWREDFMMAQFRLGDIDPSVNKYIMIMSKTCECADDISEREAKDLLSSFVEYMEDSGYVLKIEVDVKY